MLFTKPTMFIDLAATFWIVAITAMLFIWLPINGIKINSNYKTNPRLKRELTSDIWFLGLWLRNIFFLTIGVLILGYFNLINWLTLVLLYVLCLLVNYLKNYGWQIQSFKKVIQKKTIGLVDFLDRGISFADIAKNISNNYRKVAQDLKDWVSNLINRRGMAFFILLTVILGFSFLLRWEYPLTQLRFSHPDSYNTLLISRQLLAKDYHSLNHMPVLPSFIAIVSLLGSIDPMQAIRFFSPCLGIVLVVSLGFFVKVFTDNAYATLTSMLSLGVYLFTLKISNLNIVWLNRIIESLNSSLVRQWTGNELELGAIFLLLCLSYACQSDRTIRKTIAFKFNLLCGIALVALCAPPLLIILAIAAVGTVGNKQLTLSAIIFSWITLAIFAAMNYEKLTWLQDFLITLPIALSLLIGLLSAVLSDFIKILTPKWGEIFCLGLVFSLSINFLLPLTPNLTYLEYDMAARKTLEIKNHFPALSWSMVAPVEQLTEIYGDGWYQDLALFVEEYADSASQPGFEFPISGSQMFVMVEKIPFVTFPDEPDTLPNSVLSDRTYQHYRSSAGRASLEYEALRMCKAYSRLHSNSSSIYYEDRELIIYRFAKNALDSDDDGDASLT